MGDLYEVEIDLAHLWGRLSTGDSLADDGNVARWLTDRGFRRQGDRWVGDNHAVAALLPEEILAIDRVV